MLGDKREELAGIAHGRHGLSGLCWRHSLAGFVACADSLRIEGLCTPAGDGPFPLIVKIHGGPVWSLRNLWSLSYSWTPLLVARGYAVLNPNPRGSSGRGQDFGRLVLGDMGGADTYGYISAVDALVERGIADPGRVSLIGGS